MTDQLSHPPIVEIADDLPEGNEPPAYNVPGRILVHYIGPSAISVYRYECEVLDYDSDTSVFWIREGTDFSFWLDTYAEFTEPGHYVFEGITGEYIRGEWGYSEDDEEWDFASMRPATAEEIASGALNPNQPSP